MGQVTRAQLKERGDAVTQHVTQLAVDLQESALSGRMGDADRSLLESRAKVFFLFPRRASRMPFLLRYRDGQTLPP